jgi:DNA-binding response OmpR family regulator
MILDANGRPTRVLVVDDEPKIRDIVRRYLQADGFEITEAADGAAALAALAADPPDMIVLDVMMPVLNGLEVLRRIRLASTVPVIMLTAREEEIDKVLGLTAGADDYVTKPFGGRELAARLRAILRRLEPAAPSAHVVPTAPADTVLIFDAITIDPARRRTTTANGPVNLTAMDFDLLVALARSAGLVLSRRQLLMAVWKDDTYLDERVVDVHIRTLRRALGDNATKPAIIDTVRSVGYRFLPKHAARTNPMPTTPAVVSGPDGFRRAHDQRDGRTP